MKVATVSLLLALASDVAAATSPPRPTPPPPTPPPPTLRPPENHGSPSRAILGAGVSYRTVASSSGAAFPVELTLSPVPFTLSAGAVFSDAGLVHAYGEVGIWLVASAAVGGGYGAYQTAQGRKDGGTVHLFLGVPIPLHEDIISAISGRWFPYVVPYYRPSWGPWPGTAHEIGFMVKISYGIVLEGHIFGG
jgi:hypothetical protein